MKQKKQNTKVRHWRKLYLAVVIGLLLGLGATGGILSVRGMYDATYTKDMSLAQSGLQHMQKAQTLLGSMSQTSFNPGTVNQAKGEFSAALTQFTQLRSNISVLPAISTSIPVYGSRIHAAQHLVPLASHLAQAGIDGCDLLTALSLKFHDSLNLQGQGLTLTDITTIKQQVQYVEDELNNAVNEAKQVSPSDLQFDAHAAQMLTLFQHDTPTIKAWLDSSEQLLSALPTFLGVGTPANYLLEILDSSELRPGGGVISNYGSVSLSDGHLSSLHIAVTDLLDSQYKAAGHTITYPTDYSWFNKIMPNRSWSLRDSNLDADFPTAARYAEQNYKLETGGAANFQGVIAITPAFVQHILEITGPIEIPEYHVVITAQNFTEIILYHHLNPADLLVPGVIPSADEISSLYKRFAELLSEHLLSGIRSLPASATVKLFPLLLNSLHSKDVQVYFNAPSAEHVLQLLQLDSTIRSPQSDSLFVVDANAAADKVNNLITYTMHDTVSIDKDGNSTHNATLSYAWTTSGPSHESSLYQDYVRVYVPPQSTLLTQDGWQAKDPIDAFGREVWSGVLRLNYGQTHTISLSWSVPKAAQHDAAGWHYTMQLQRQSGILWTVDTQTSLPSCATAIHTSSSLLHQDKNLLMLTTHLNEDMNIGMNYTC